MDVQTENFNQQSAGEDIQNDIIDDNCISFHAIAEILCLDSLRYSLSYLALKLRSAALMTLEIIVKLPGRCCKQMQKIADLIDEIFAENEGHDIDSRHFGNPSDKPDYASKQHSEIQDEDEHNHSKACKGLPQFHYGGLSIFSQAPLKNPERKKEAPDPGSSSLSLV